MTDNLIYSTSKASGALYITNDNQRVMLGEVTIGTSGTAFHGTGSCKRMTNDARDVELAEMLVLEEALESISAQLKEAIASKLPQTEV